MTRSAHRRLLPASLLAAVATACAVMLSAAGVVASLGGASAACVSAPGAATGTLSPSMGPAVPPGAGPGGSRGPGLPRGEPAVGTRLRGYTSVFSDHATAGRHPADGAYPGIATPLAGALGGYWQVTYANGRVLVLEQIDVGPAPGLGPAPEHRVVDTDTAAAVTAGYVPSRFPTDRGLVTAVYLGRDPRWAALNGRVAAETLQPSSGECATPEPPQAHPGPGGYALPLDRRYLTALGRTDDGVDIETAPDGVPVYSMTPGVCTAVATNPAGFGPSYPVIEAAEGPLRGWFIYYGHVARATVRPGQRVAAGQPIAVMGHTGDAAALGHGHIEIGFSDAGGNPIDHHGASAATPSGRRMRRFLIGLAASVGIRLY